MTIRILIVDDHVLVRDGLCSLIDNAPGLSVSGQFSSGEEAIRALEKDPPDLLLVDLHMEGLDGTKVISAACLICPNTRILALTAYTSASYVYSALHAGAHGYIVKSESGDSILRAIRCVMDGKAYLSPEITEEVINGYVRGRQHFSEGPYDGLTQREREIVEFMILGESSNKALSGRLFISERTVERHKTNIFRKLGVATTQELLEQFVNDE